jgi:hypothetical protein
MTESLWFEANEDKAAELDRLASRLAATRENLLNEALDLLLAAHRARAQGEEPIGMLAGLHDVMARLRKMIEELRYIRMTTCGVTLSELGVQGNALEAIGRHYEKIHQSSERALAAAGFGPMLVTVIEATEEPPSGTADQRIAPSTPRKLKRYRNE